MSDQLVSPQDTYGRLMNEASDSRRKRSLEAINEACRLLHERHSSDFSYKTIITLGKDRGLPVPGEKSIVNATGAHYRELIQSWRLVSLPKASKTKADPNDWIEHIQDPVLRMSVRLLAKELRALKAKESRKAKYSGAPIILGSTAGQAVSTRPLLNDAELAALKAAIDPASLGLVGLSIGSRGELVDVKRRTIHKPGFRDAIEKVLAVQVK
ncbi:MULTISPECIES: gamma-mobile-trio protein GmtX [Stutzerimonas stutzeri subgroup]|uniref:Uncharacterized protein n=2 Tax=Stutzerimonas stutzeri subgroup TaxID=578833 RepID=A0A0D7DYB3_STUST|nr:MULTISPECIES: gamma-mobile-trio protein GmtX [Stutzerimonas stutzeri subgroup]KIZ33549.1 hypothetical protein LO50_20600 [Stutzerimonas stutzeri]MCD1609184.1 hypothetical protein [Stutzerimonas kunmingensis]OCX95772.1 MAG: hypothetical protein BCV62_13610 [Pseudomonas sp. K35]PNG00912.1 hypothetical protein CXK98_09325 [Stutzerimonas kunmingensis]